MAKNKNNKNLGKKNVNKNNNCKLTQNCNTSDVTDSVEFANEPFDNVNKKKCAKDKRNNNNC